jgi:hypothetical protein
MHWSREVPLEQMAYTNHIPYSFCRVYCRSVLSTKPVLGEPEALTGTF